MGELVFVDERLEVKKTQELVRSRYRLKPLALKLITTLISGVQNDDTSKQEYCIRVKDFTDLQGIKGKDYYKKLDDATEEILKKPITIKLAENDFLKMNWCSSIEYKDGQGLIKFQISPKLLPYIKDLKNNYLKYDLMNILPLRSEYSIRIYEWLKDELNKYTRYGKKAELVLELSEIVKRLEIPKSYQLIHIKERVLDKAKEDLEKNCDVSFDWEVAQKNGRKVTHIKFIIYSNKKNIAIAQLPPYLDTFMSYVNYLKAIYKDNNSYFILMSVDIGDGRGLYYFGVDKNDYIFAMSSDGGYGKKVNKEMAEKALNASYLCSLYSEVYRDFIKNSEDIWEISRKLQYEKYWSVLGEEISNVLNEHDCRVKPII